MMSNKRQINYQKPKKYSLRYNPTPSRIQDMSSRQKRRYNKIEKKQNVQNNVETYEYQKFTQLEVDFMKQVVYIIIAIIIVLTLIKY